MQLKDQGVINNSISADLNEIQEFTGTLMHIPHHRRARLTVVRRGLVYIHFVWCSFFEMTVCIAVLFYVRTSPIHRCCNDNHDRYRRSWGQRPWRA